MADAARENGPQLSFFPAELVLPMVAPCDLGQAAARRLMAPVSDTGVQHVEGPERYTAQEVAEALTDAVGRKLDVQEIPRDALEETFGQFGFSDEAAASYACMTGKLIDGQTDATSEPVRGKTSLREYIRSVLGAD